MRKYLTRTQAVAWRERIEAALARKRDTWGIHGWGFVGKHPRLRVAVRVPQRLIAPTTAAGALKFRYDGGRLITLKVAVEASHAGEVKP